MKVVYFNYLYDIRNLSVGSSVHVEEFAKHFAHFHDIKVFYQNKFNSEQGNGKYNINFRTQLKSKLSKWLNHINCFLKNIKYIKSEYRIIINERPDLIITRYDLLNFSSVLLAKIFRIPILLEVNAPHAYESKNFYEQYIHLPILPELIEKLVLKFVDAIFVVSSELKKYFVNLGVSKSKIFVICNGVDVKKFTPDHRRSETRKELKFNREIVIGFIGSFHYWHGIDKFLSVINNILQTQSNVKFLLVGDGVLKKDVEDFIQKNQFEEKVILPGYVPHEKISDYLSAIDIVVAPYPKIDFFYFSPLKIFEYMASGKAIVASGLGQINEIIEHGKNGLLAKTGDLNNFADNLRLLIGDQQLRDSMGKAARETVELSYSWYKNAEQISNICSGLISKKKC